MQGELSSCCRHAPPSQRRRASICWCDGSEQENEEPATLFLHMAPTHTVFTQSPAPVQYHTFVSFKTKKWGTSAKFYRSQNWTLVHTFDEAKTFVLFIHWLYFYFAQFLGRFALKNTGKEQLCLLGMNHLSAVLWGNLVLFWQTMKWNGRRKEMEGAEGGLFIGNFLL